MINTVYSVFDRRHRPLRNSVYLAFPDRNIAFARVSETAFNFLEPVLALLAGVEPKQNSEPDARLSVHSCGALFRGNVQLLTARELKRRYPSMPVVAVVQDPVERLAASFEQLVLSDRPLPSFYSEALFRKDMTPTEFVLQAIDISDLAADNLLRSQTAIMTHKGQLVPDTVFRIEDLTGALDRFALACRLDLTEISGPVNLASDTTRRRGLSDFYDDRIVELIRTRYRSDMANYYAGSSNFSLRSHGPSGRSSKAALELSANQ